MFHVEQSFSPEKDLRPLRPIGQPAVPTRRSPCTPSKTTKMWFWVVFYPRKTARQRKNHLHID